MVCISFALSLSLLFFQSCQACSWESWLTRNEADSCTWIRATLRDVTHNESIYSDNQIKEITEYMRKRAAVYGSDPSGFHPAVALMEADAALAAGILAKALINDYFTGSKELIHKLGYTWGGGSNERERQAYDRVRIKGALTENFGLNTNFVGCIGVLVNGSPRAKAYADVFLNATTKPKASELSSLLRTGEWAEDQNFLTLGDELGWHYIDMFAAANPVRKDVTKEPHWIVQVRESLTKEEPLSKSFIEKITNPPFRFRVGLPNISRYLDENFCPATEVLGFNETAFIVQGIQYLKRAVEAGDTFAQRDLGLLLVEGLYGARKELGLGETEAITQGAQYLEKAAEAGNAEAQSDLGLLLVEGLYGARKALGLGDAEAITRGVQYLKQAAEAGNTFAQSDLGFLLVEGLYGARKELGLGETEAITQGAQYLEKAAEAGNTFAQNNLGCFLVGGLYGVREELGLGEDEAITRGVQYLKQAAEVGNTFAQNNLGRCLVEGLYGVRKELGLGEAEAITQGVQYLEKAAEAGNTFARSNLGRYLVEGLYGVREKLGLGEDEAITRGIQYLEKAAEAGNTEALDFLGSEEMKRLLPILKKAKRVTFR